MRFISVAMDAQGWPRVSKFVKDAGLEFDAVVDRTGKLWSHLDFNVVPLQFYFDESGHLIYRTQGKPEGEVLERLDQALSLPPAKGAGAQAVLAELGEESKGLFLQGVAEMDAGRKDKALELWRRALAAEPDNWLIRKQIWALEQPGRFYDGNIDYAWQKTRMAAGDGPD